MPERCRYCNRRLDRSDTEHRRFWPFCSERCRMAELGLWFADRYALSRPVDEVADDAAPGAAGGPEAAGKPASAVPSPPRKKPRRRAVRKDARKTE